MTAPFTVEVTLYVEDDGPDEALALAVSILTAAGGRGDIPDAGDDYSGFGFALGPVGRVDRFGRSWPFPAAELCPTCGQPDSCGDCNHQPLSDDEAATLLGEGGTA